MKRIEGRQRRHLRIRRRIYGTAEKPRLCVFRSNSHLYAQIINDEKNTVICSASTLSSHVRAEIKPSTKKAEMARLVGKYLGAQAKKKKIGIVVFDRSGYRYHGRVKALAEGTKEGGLRF